MKKLSVLLVALAVAVSASAGVNLKAPRVVKSNKVINTEMTKMKVVRPQATQFRAPMTEEPQGEKKFYDRAGDAVYVDGSSLTYGTQSKQVEVVYGEENKVFIKNILFGCGSYFGDTWVEGYVTEDGTELRVPLGQSIYWSDSYQADVVLAMGETVIEYDEVDESYYIAFYPDEEQTEAVYAIDGTTLTLQNTYKTDNPDSPYPGYEAYGLGSYWTDDNSFGGFLEWNTVLTEGEPIVAPTVITEQPEGQMYTYWRKGASIYSSWGSIYESIMDGKMDVVFGEGGKVYIHNPLWYAESLDSWVEGTYDWMTGIITIPVGQYLSWSDAYEYGVQLWWGYSEITGDETEGYSFAYAQDERATEIYYMIDDDKIYLLGGEGDPNAEFPMNYQATGLLGLWSDDASFVCLEFVGPDQVAGQLVNNVPAVPADPTADDWYDCGNENGYSRFYFTLPTTDVDGNPIDTELLSYSIYTDDDEIFTFDANTYYYDLSDDMTEIPYWIYSSGYDFRPGYVYFYRTNMGDNPLFENRIGIQVHYTVDGVKNSSNIVYFEVAPTVPAVPENPGDLTWSDCGDESGYSRFGFTLPTTDVDGNPLNEMCISYSIFLDNDQIFTFDAETYSDLDEDMTEIPYSVWSSGWDFYKGAVYFYRTNAEGYDPLFNHQIGIQVYYTVDGVVNASDIVYLEVFPDTKVNELNANKTVANVRYFNMAGQEMAQPEGMTIQVTTYTDGTTSAVKVVK
jgi:hypothetical protein